MLAERLRGHGITLSSYTLGQHATTCPNCSAGRKKKNDPCLSVKLDDEGAVWCCNHCDFKGGFRDTDEPAPHKHKPKPRKAPPPTLEPLPPQAVEWFAKRGISRATLDRAGVKWSPAIYFRDLKGTRPAIAFVHRRDDRVINAKFRPLLEKEFAQIAGGEKRFYLGELCDGTLTDTLVITEGETDALALLEARIDCTVSVPDGAPKQRLNGLGDAKFAFIRNEAEILGRFSRIVLAVDNDEAGCVLRDELLDRLGPERCFIPTWPDGCKDANDVLMRHGVEVLQHCIDAAKPAPQRTDKRGSVSATALLTMEFKPMKWVLEPYLAEGVTLLAGRPKCGKSWLALLWAVEVSQRGGGVLYMGLEDNLRRLQKRLKAILQGAAPGDGASVATEWRNLDDGGLDDLRKWLAEHKDARLVVIDTLQKVRPHLTKNTNEYEADYKLLGQLKAIADEFGVAIVVVHHTRKSDAGDFVDAVAGSTALTGGADAILVLSRPRGDKVAMLKGVGRDLEGEIDDALSFDEATGRWNRVGSGDEYRQSESRREVIHSIRTLQPVTPSELARVMGKERTNIQHQLKRLVEEGAAIKIGGKYSIIGSA